MANVASFEKWNPFGVYLNLYVESAEVTRTDVSKYQVKMKVKWTTSGTWYKMEASSGGSTVVLHDGQSGTSGSSGWLTGTYSIDGYGGATKSVTVTFKNTHSDKASTYKTKALSFNVTVPAWPSYTIQYNTNGGSGTFAKQTKYKNQSLTLRSGEPTRTGYTFKGWALTKNLADEGTWYYQPGGTCGKNENLTLYAVWSANKYTITYNKNTTDNVTGLPSAQTKTYDESLTLSSAKPARIDYNFLGWADTSGATKANYAAGSAFSTNITANKTLYAVWELAYVRPKVHEFSVYRCSEVVDENQQTVYRNDDNGTFLGIRYRIEFDPKAISDNTTPAIDIQWTPGDDSGGSNEAYIAAVKDGSTASVVILNDTSEDGYTPKFNPEKSYSLVINVEDDIGDVVITRTLSGTNFPIDVKKGGTGIAFGKPAEEEGVADFNFRVRHGAGLLYPVLPDNADLDDEAYRIPNTYVGDNATNSNYKNMPREIVNSTFTLEVISAGPDGQVVQRITRCHKTEPIVLERFWYSNAWGDWTGGWITPVLTSKFTNYANSDANAPVYRRVGNMVEIRGAVAPTETITGGDTNHQIFTLPVGYRPSMNVYSLQQGSGQAIWLLRVSSGGSVDFTRYRIGNAWADAVAKTDTTDGAWLPFQITYFV